MAKIYTFMIISVGLTLLLKLAGIPAGADTFLSWLGLTPNSSAGLGLGGFSLAVGALFTIGAIGGIAVSFITRINPESYLVGVTVAPGLLAVFLGTFVSIMNYTSSYGWIGYVVFLVFAPLTIGFLVSIVSYWRGSD